MALGQVFLRVLRFSAVSIFHKCSILIFIYTLLLPEGQKGEAWILSRKKCCSENRGAASIFLVFEGLKVYHVLSEILTK